MTKYTLENESQEPTLKLSLVKATDGTPVVTATTKDGTVYDVCAFLPNGRLYFFKNLPKDIGLAVGNEGWLSGITIQVNHIPAPYGRGNNL